MAEDRQCMMCKRPFAAVRVDAFFCSARCRSAHSRELKRDERKEELEHRRRLLFEFRPQIRQVRNAVVSRAPANAGGYLLGMWASDVGDYIWLPYMQSDQQRRRTVAGSWSRQRFFALHPFEVPAVPKVGTYRVAFVTENPPHGILPEKEETEVEIPFSVDIARIPKNAKPGKS
jgi:hypothetical protein